MPSKLKNDPETFQRAMGAIRFLVKWQLIFVYPNNVVLFSRSPSNHINLIKQVLSLFQDARVTLKLKKCSFFTEITDYLGHVAHLRGLEIATHTTAAIKEQKPPTNVTEFCSVLGLCDVFRHFVPNFARIAPPLTNKLKKDLPKLFLDVTAQ